MLPDQYELEYRRRIAWQITQKSKPADAGTDKINRMESGGAESAAVCQQS